MAQTKANKQANKLTKVGTKKGKGGSDSGSNSRASTPVSDRPALGRPPKRSLADDEVKLTIIQNTIIIRNFVY